MRIRTAVISKGIRLLGMLGLVSVIMGCETTRRVEIAEAPTLPTWEGAEIAIPVAVGGVNCAGYVYKDCLERIASAEKIPVVVYMHGCDGPNAESVRQLLKAGYVVVAPNSLRREKRPAIDCVPGSDKQAIMRLRIEEAAYAARKLRE